MLLIRNNWLPSVIRVAGTPAVLPFPDFAPLRQYTDLVQDQIAELETNVHDPDRTAEIMESKGYALNGDGFWEKDGEVVEMVVEIFQIFEDITPILVVAIASCWLQCKFPYAIGLLIIV